MKRRIYPIIAVTKVPLEASVTTMLADESMLQEFIHRTEAQGQVDQILVYRLTQTRTAERKIAVVDVEIDLAVPFFSNQRTE